MECKRSMLLVLWAALVIPAAIAARNFDDQKNFFPPYPPLGTPPTVSYTPPAHGSGGGHATPTPSPPANCGNPPSGGGGHHSTPSTPSHHANPSPSHHSSPSPSYHSSPSPSHHSSPSPSHHSSPSTPSHHSSPSPSHHSSTPTPSHGSGGYYHSPPTSTPTPTPTPTTPATPTKPTPVTVTPPSTPSTPSISVPSPPSSFDPNSPPFTCTYWKNHPTLIWALFGWSGTTVGKAFGVSIVPGIGAGTDILGALSNPRTDGLGDLCREGTAALLNSMMHKKFPYTTDQVKEKFVAACSSIKAAAAQAQQFKLANEGKATPSA